MDIAMEDCIDAQKLIVAIVQSQHAGEVQAGLLEADYRVTRINTAGGFLRRGNVTFLIGVHSDQVDEVIDIVKDRAPRADESKNPDAPPLGTMLFVLPIARFARI